MDSEAAPALSDSLIAQASLLNELVNVAIEPALKRAGLSAGEFELLSAFHGAGEGATQVQVAARLGITPPSLTEALKHVIRDGWVEQVPSKLDGRSKHIKLTRKGRSAFRAAIEAVGQLEQKMSEGLDPKEVGAALRVLKNANMRLVRISLSLGEE